MRWLPASRSSRVRVACIVGTCMLVPAVLPGSGCQTAPPQQEEGVTDVAIQGFAFSPAEVTIKRGESIRWTNHDLVPHTATSGNPGDADAGGIFDTANLASGQSMTVPFNDTGEFVYFCRLHPTMMFGAKVTVTE